MTSRRDTEPDSPRPELRVRSDWPFFVGLGVIGGSYVLLLAGMLVAEAMHTSLDDIVASLQTPEIQYSIKLSLLSCAITTILSVWVAVPIGYVMSRHEFPGKALVDSLLDIPIVLPPLVVGLCLLIFFRSRAVLLTESLLHGLEGFLSDNLVPAVWLLGLSAGGLALYLALKRAIRSRRTRLAIAAAAVAVPFVAVSWNYLFAKMPSWVPVPERFSLLDVDYRDQSPLVESRTVYTGRYRFTGTAGELAAAIESTCREKGLPDVRVLGNPDALKREGRPRWLAEVPESVRSGTGFDGEVVIAAAPADQSGDFQPDDVTDWLVTIDVQRPLHRSEARVVPKLTFPVTLEIPAVILAQFMVACAFAVRTMRVTFDQLDQRFENVALTLGCSRSQAFWRVVLPQCRRGMLAAATLAWARSLGEFGPILIFAGSTRLKTEVLSTTVFLEMTVGNIEGAVAASLIMVGSAIIVLVIARVFGLKRLSF